MPKVNKRSISFDSSQQQSTCCFFLYLPQDTQCHGDYCHPLWFFVPSELSLARSSRRAEWQIATFNDGHAMLQSVSCSWVGVGFSALQDACKSNWQTLKNVHHLSRGHRGKQQRKDITIKGRSALWSLHLWRSNCRSQEDRPLSRLWQKQHFIIHRHFIFRELRWKIFICQWTYQESSKGNISHIWKSQYLLVHTKNTDW